MTISFYTYGWDLIRGGFDYRNALDNYSLYADEISVAINTSTDGTYEAVESYAKIRGYPVKMTATSFDPINDPFFYGKVVNAALQACTGDLMVAQDMDERWWGNKEILLYIGEKLAAHPTAKAVWVPTVDIYGDKYHALPLANKKWYVHKPGLFRGAVNFAIKSDGRPDYSKSSTDELISVDGNLVPTLSLIQEPITIESLKPYVAQGLPLSFHLGYVSFNERLSRSLWWRDYWIRATGGDENKHPTSIEEMANRVTVEHGLPLWLVNNKERE